MSGPRDSTDRHSTTSPRRSTGERPSIALLTHKKSRGKKLTADDFKGLIAPVLACFDDDDLRTLNTDNIDRYATWLKREQVRGICVNSITGEGPAMGLNERRSQLEAWWVAANKHDLLTMVQIGGAPLPDVQQLAEHAEQLGVHAVICLPEMYFKPKSLDHLVGYCKLVSKKCPTRPFLYYHIPSLTFVEFDLNDFCTRAEKAIPNFMGILFSSGNIQEGSKCFRDGRVVMLGNSQLFVSGILLGYKTFMGSFITVRPDIARAIANAMNANDLQLASTRQQQLNEIIRYFVNKATTSQWVECIKSWFNNENSHSRGPRFEAGPIRSFSLKKSIN